jgi:hypothetical protein
MTKVENETSVPIPTFEKYANLDFTTLADKVVREYIEREELE